MSFRSHRHSYGLRAALAFFLALALAAPAWSAPVRVARSTPWAPDAKVRDSVKQQCQLDTKIPAAIAANAADVELVDGSPGRGSGRALELTLHDVHSPGGGAFSGPKWAEVRGKLYDGGQLVGSFRAKRFTTGGAFGMFMGTCAILTRVTRALGRDIAGFLGAPRMDAELGDAR